MIDKVYVANEKSLQAKIAAIKSDGVQSLHIVSDFDRTLTKCFYNGKKTPSAISLLREGGYLTPDYAPKAFALFDKYHPVEIDSSLSMDFKKQQMLCWWTEHEQLFIECGLREEVFDDVVERYPRILREGCVELFKEVDKYNIPMLIFSAGIGNLIDKYLAHYKLKSPQVHIVSNTFGFDESGKATGYVGEVIHTFTKSETHFRDTPFYKTIEGRKNVILLGDSLGDLTMVDDVNMDTVIKIGFLNENVQSNLELYLSKFDIVVPNDGTLDYVTYVFSKFLEN